MFTGLTAVEVRALFDYDPDTGVLCRKSTGKRGSKDGKGALQFTVGGRKGRLYLAHRLAWLHFYGSWPLANIDHINGNPADNRIANLREATDSQNNSNKKTQRNNRSGVAGVFWQQNVGRWRARVQWARKRTHIGFFDRFEDAVEARRKAELQLFGEFAPSVSRKIQLGP